jgi:alkanesulfonate monooxygenase SsuD/methylene tetrahydromethanopterin reductase-like flavin-dependent oxidoreductase (luciferase family)
MKPSRGRLRLSLLDFADIDPLALAPFAEDLGYSRVWLAEHQSNGALHADALLMSMAVASVTRRIRVGPGGVLLRFRSPLAVANAARLLDSIFPGRVDIGLAAGSAKDPERLALLDGRPDYSSRDDHRRRVQEVVDLVRNRKAERPVPESDDAPVFWYLDSSGQAASFAGRIGAGYALSLLHHEDSASERAVHAYRAAFVPSTELPQPAAIVAVAVACTDIASELRPHAAIKRVVRGSVHECAAAIVQIAERYDVDEVMVLELSAGEADRRRALSGLAEATHISMPEAWSFASREDSTLPPGAPIWLQREHARSCPAGGLENDVLVRGVMLPNGWRADTSPAVDEYGTRRLVARARVTLT